MSARRYRSIRLHIAALLLTAAAMLILATPVGAQSPIELIRNACLQTSENPYVVTTFARPGVREDDGGAVIAFRDTSANTGQIALATARQVGATWGLAYDAANEILYVAAFHKRGTHFGPAGPGGVYSIDIETGDVATLAVVPNPGIDAHDPTNDYFPDISGRFPAGKTSLGDLDIKPDGSELAVVNLNDRRIYRVRLPDGELLGSFAHGAAAESWAAEDARPWGLGYRDDRLYHTVVRTAESTQDHDEMLGLLYESAPDGSGMRLVGQAGLNYERGWVWVGDGLAIWNPWLDPPGNVAASNGRYPMPILTDIEFTNSGDQMILGLRDRFGDETFYTTPPNSPPPGERVYNTPAGDILPAWPQGGEWRIQVSPEYYTGDHGPQGTANGHDETGFGGLAVIPGHDVVVSSVNSPYRVSSAGAMWLSTTAGSDDRREELYRFGEGDNFGKANGLGDVEVLCPRSETATPVPTPTPTPTATDTAPPTSTVTATDTPSPSETVPPTATPSLSPTPPGPTPTGTLPTATNTKPATATTTRTPPEDTPRPPSQPTPTVVIPKLPKTGGGPGEGGGACTFATLFAATLAVLVLSAGWRRLRDVAKRAARLPSS